MRLSIALLMLTAVGCQNDPYTATYTTNQPTEEQLVGTYVPDHATAALIAREGRYTQSGATITLAADGVITITNIPDWWLTDFGHPKGGVDSGRGTWSIQPHHRWWAIAVGFESTKQFASRPNTRGLTTGMRLVGERPPYKVHLTIGDPDDGRAMQFEKAPSSNAR